MRVIRVAAFAAVLVAVTACACVGAVRQTTFTYASELPHRCVHDELQRRVAQAGMPSASVIGATTSTTNREANNLADGWEPLRIGVFADDINNPQLYCNSVGQTVPDHTGGTVTCAAADILTAEKRNTLTQYLFPAAAQLHEKYLQVQRVLGYIVPPNFAGVPVCGTFAVPSYQYVAGVGDVDFVAYAASTPTSDNVVAFALTCAQLPNSNRPGFGAINVGSRYVARNAETVRIVTHELLHALGFTVTFFGASNMITQATSIRGKPGTQSVVNSTNVVREARTQYNCDTLSGMELEDEGGSGTAGSHWKRRNAKDDLMAGIVSAGYYTAITIAAMEDLGYYKGNYTDAEIMPWGRNAGCDLLTQKCMTDNITAYPSMFCNDTSAFRCGSARTAIGACVIQANATNPPDYFRYFTNPSLIGSPNLVDYCPIVEEFADLSCVTTNILSGMATGVNARCFDARNLPQQANLPVEGICAQISCVASSSTYQVQFAGSSRFIDCPAGATIDLSTTGATLNVGTVTCAPYNEVCQILTSLNFTSAAAPMHQASACLFALLAILTVYLIG